MRAAAAIALAAALLLVSWRDAQRRAWALVAISGAVLYLALRALPQLLAAGRVPGVQWNWGGHLLALGGMLVLAFLLVRKAGLSPRELGFAAPDHLGVAALVCATALLASALLQTIGAGRTEPIPMSTWLFESTMPGLAEEVAFRGVLLAAAERAAPARRMIGGIPVSAGAALLTAAFVGLHGFGIGVLVSVLPGALLYLWLRLRTGSVVVSIVAHNLWNLTVLAVYL